MGRFASAAKQAASVMKALQGHHLKAVGTVRNYEQALTRVAEYVKAERLPHGLRGLTPAQALIYLEKRGQDVGQKTLDMERQAIQSMFHHVTGQLAPDERLTVVKSAHQQVLTSRGYTPAQIHLIVDAQTTRNALATELAYAAGLRAHELYTLQPAHERPAHVRPALDSKWQGRDGVLYTVHGKGGLVRHVLIPIPLAERLETHRLATPQSVTDRGIHYQQHYAINGGHRWSSAFTSASQRVLGWSAGAHGLRHTYAQERMHELQRQGLTRIHALETVSQEMGHFRPDITGDLLAVKWRLIFLLVLLAALGAGGYWLNLLLYRYGLAIYTPEHDWVIVSYGWDTLRHLWPLALVGLLVGGVIAFVIVMYSYSVAKTLDERGEFFLMHRDVETAEARAANAERLAEANYRNKLAAVEEREQAATQVQQAAEAAQQQALSEIEQARAAVQRANTAAADAEARRKRAFNGFRRLQKKLERLQGA